MNHAKKMMIDHIARFGSDNHCGWGAVSSNGVIALMMSTTRKMK